MSRVIRIYVGCSLTGASKEFKQLVESFKDTLRKKYEVLDFVGFSPDNPERVFRHDFEHCLARADLFVAVATHPASGLGMEIGGALWMKDIPMPLLVLSEESAYVTSAIRGIPETYPRLIFTYKNLIREGADFVRQAILNLVDTEATDVPLSLEKYSSRAIHERELDLYLYRNGPSTVEELKKVSGDTNSALVSKIKNGQNERRIARVKQTMTMRVFLEDWIRTKPCGLELSIHEVFVEKKTSLAFIEIKEICEKKLESKVDDDKLVHVLKLLEQKSFIEITIPKRNIGEFYYYDYVCTCTTLAANLQESWLFTPALNELNKLIKAFLDHDDVSVTDDRAQVMYFCALVIYENNYKKAYNAFRDFLVTTLSVKKIQTSLVDMAVDALSVLKSYGEEDFTLFLEL